MAKAAAVVVASAYPCSVGVRADRRLITAWFHTFLSLLIGFFGRLADRIRARVAFHDPARYRELVSQAFAFAGAPLRGFDPLRRLRKLDPDGLGIWYLARGGDQPRLHELCRKAMALPGLGPPRSIARSLDRAWGSEATCLFGESAGFDALMAASLIGAGHAATLVAAYLTSSDATTSLLHASNHLTRTASALQSAGRAHDRVIARSPSPAQETTRWIFQAVNLLRRALNHTDLLAVDEQMARESARQALAAASAACVAAVKLNDDLSTDEVGTEARDKLAALARTVDALTSRVASSLRAEPSQVSAQKFLVEQSVRVLADAVKSLRPWHIELSCPDITSNAGDIQNLCARANDFTEACAEVLESWAVLHELCSTSEKSAAPAGRDATTLTPRWAERLLRALARRWCCQDVIQSLRCVSGRTEQAVTAAVELSALRAGSLQLRRELWTLIRASRSSSLERSLAFQLFLRIEQY